MDFMENKKKDKREEKKMIYEKIRDKIISMFPDMYKKINITLSERDKKSGKKPDIRNTEETIEYLLANECSMSRLGDGEFILIFGGRENYQKYDKELVKKLVEILHSNLSNHIVCISDVFGNLAERNDENKKYWKEHLRVYRHKYYKYIDMNKTYYNTSATRVYKLLENKSLAKPRFEKWRLLWENKDIVFIEGKETRMGIGNDLFSNAKSIRRIIGPAENAFDYWKELLIEAKKIEKTALFILALGPTATVLSYELSKEGYRALDLGHVDLEYEWYLKQNSNIVIQGKYTNEVSGGNMVEECNDNVYKNEIIYSIY